MTGRELVSVRFTSAWAKIKKRSWLPTQRKKSVFDFLVSTAVTDRSHLYISKEEFPSYQWLLVTLA